jgi:hypothetical protein
VLESLSKGQWVAVQGQLWLLTALSAAAAAPAAAQVAETKLGSHDPSLLPASRAVSRAPVCLSKSQELFEELYIELSAAAARCYSYCGRKRNAALMRADVADALLRRGMLREAATLFEWQALIFTHEAWHRLAAAVLPKLIACQKVPAAHWDPPSPGGGGGVV